MGRSILSPVIVGFLKANPRVTAKAVLLDRVVNLIDEGIDVALRVGELPDSTMIARHVGEVRRLLVASPEYISRCGLPKSAGELKLHSIIDFTGLLPNRKWSYLGGKGMSHVALQPRFEINDSTAALAAAESGAGITVAFSYTVANQLRDGRLVPDLASIWQPPVPVQLAYPESRIVAPKVRAFVNYAAPKIRAALQELKPKLRRSGKVS